MSRFWPFASIFGRINFLTTFYSRNSTPTFRRKMATLRDPNTLSNYDKWTTRHITAQLEIDFKSKRLVGNVILKLKSLTDADSKEIKLDTSFLNINKIKVDGKETKWSLADRVEPYGSALTVELENGVAKDKDVDVDVSLNTTDQCTALQWLTPEQTPNKKFPYMFSQCQAIHARSCFPCQDTPDVKASVSFKITSPLQVIASGNPQSGEKGHGTETGGDLGKPVLYEFEQPVPIPSYLFAIASGDLRSAKIGPRSTVWSGPGEIAGCQWELEEDMEKFLEAAESIIFKYQWGTYNVLVLPASFPYGGMENPTHTFATPTIISKDRQNIDVIAHELSHSWSGNLVSNGSWEHFWLNEGWTTYLERRIQAMIHGEKFRDFSAIIGWKALENSVELFGADHEFTKLVVNLKGQDPDDAFSSVPYEKGFVFLDYLEKLISRSKWDKFIPHYFNTWKFKSLDSFEFKATLIDFFADDEEVSTKLTELDWDVWFYKPGYPPKPDYDDSMVVQCYELAEKWKQRGNSGSNFEPSRSDISSWSANQSVVFLERLQSFPKPPISVDDVALLGSTYGFAASENVELVSRFYGVGLMARAKNVYEPTADLLGRVGRMKFVRPLYRLLAECDREYAIKVFEKNRGFYHPICRALVERDLYGEKNGA